MLQGAERNHWFIINIDQTPVYLLMHPKKRLKFLEPLSSGQQEMTQSALLLRLPSWQR
jgi:hypothetical protein